MSLCSSEGNKLIEKIDKALEISRIMKDVECFSYLDRYTGSEDGEKAAERIAKRMEELGIPVEREIYQVYRSLPGEASIRIQGDSSEAIVPLTKAAAVDLIEEAADKAEKKSLGKKIAGLFSPTYTKEGLLILHEKDFFD